MSSGGFRRFWTEGPGSFAVAILLALTIRWAFLEAYVIPSGSMIPSLMINDHIFVNKIIFGLRMPFSEQWLTMWRDPQRGEVIVFRYPGNRDLFYVKRVIGVPGDEVLFENGHLYINGDLVEKTIPQSLKDDWEMVRDADFPGDLQAGGKSLYVHWQETLGERTYSVALRKEAERTTFGPQRVPEGHYFVLGDNRDNSQDSRAWTADATPASGVVTLWRERQGPSIELPAGLTIGSRDGRLDFVTTEKARLTGLSVDVPVQSQIVGALANLPPAHLTVVKSEALAKQLNVTNAKSTHGGVDKRFVPRESILGKASFVLLSCEETLPMVSFLCHPLRIRWQRFFHIVR